MKKQKIYAEVLEEIALEQFNDAMTQDFVVQGALMPDAHMGYSLPIGAVVATKDMIVPAWVGYDIGCGMCAVPTTFHADHIKGCAKEIFDKIYELVPVGFNVNQKHIDCDLSPVDLSELGRKAFDARKGFRSLGSLGGGNHFIEIGQDERGVVWIVIHSGSRGLGHGIAQEYMRLASGDGKVREGHFGFDVNSEDGKNYINDMNWALKFALANREEMIKRVDVAMSTYCKGWLQWHHLINRNHNHAELRDGLWIHRKGATHAEKGMLGVIPGNMRDGSFIVKGKGNPESLFSSSHGAGRVLGRKAAKRALNTDDFRVEMVGIQAKVEDCTLDESPMAYKNIFEVMELQKDLIEVLHHIKPLINIKG
jgi:tRNA-splicing ligase RtcB